MLEFSFLELLKDLFFYAGYLTGNKAFPKPLSSEEEKKYIALLSQGDEEAKRILIEKNLRLVAHIAKKYSNLNMDMDDLISIGTIGLIKGINTFNPQKGSGLATYVARCIDNEILMTIRASKKYAGEVSINEPIGVDKEGNNISFVDILGTEDDMVDRQVELKLQVKRLYDQMKKVLSQREKTIIELRYGLGFEKPLTQKEIAKNLGISRSYVSRIEKKALEKLRTKFDQLN